MTARRPEPPTRAEVEAMIERLHICAETFYGYGRYTEAGNVRDGIAMLRALVAQDTPPREPTTDMIEEGMAAAYDGMPLTILQATSVATSVWRAMYDATPRPAAAPSYPADCIGGKERK